MKEYTQVIHGHSDITDRYDIMKTSSLKCSNKRIKDSLESIIIFLYCLLIIQFGK
jgi:hypothetical protein